MRWRGWVYVSFMGLLSACSSHKTIKKLTVSNKPIHISQNLSDYSPPINIWIHGTRFFRRPLFHGFFKNKPGLRLAQELESDYYLRKISNTLSHICPEQFCLETFYLFGWSGKLRSSSRQEAAEVLFDEIIRICREYREKYKKSPFLRIMTHSHGGSVALNLAHVKKTKGELFKINELILLACPVQEATCSYIEDSLFDHIFSLYSSLDLVQVLAPQVIYNVYRTKKGRLRSRIHWPIFSYRRFREHPKLAQIKIKINGRALFHTDFTSHRFISLLPYIIHVMNAWYKQHTIPHSTHFLCM